MSAEIIEQTQDSAIIIRVFAHGSAELKQERGGTLNSIWIPKTLRNELADKIRLKPEPTPEQKKVMEKYRIKG